MWQFGQNNFCHSLWKFAQSAINRPIWSHCLLHSLSAPFLAVSFEPIFKALPFKAILNQTVLVNFTTTAPLAVNSRTVLTSLPIKIVWTCRTASRGSSASAGTSPSATATTFEQWRPCCNLEKNGFVKICWIKITLILSAVHHHWYKVSKPTLRPSW